MAGNDGSDCDEGLVVRESGFGDEVDSFVGGELFFDEEGFFGGVDEEEVAFAVAGEEVVLILGLGAETGDFVVDLDEGLGDVLLDAAFVSRVFFLLLNVVHGELELMEDSFVENIVDEAIGLREMILEMSGVGDLPGEQVGCGHSDNRKCCKM
jgi:hypothetical protein